MRFSVITVCLNPGEKLRATLDSVLGQTCADVEVVLKDGGSTDGSLEKWEREAATVSGAERVRVIREKDSGIYDAMNQAMAHAKGEFFLFLNCGDVFPDKEVLERTLLRIEEEEKAGTDMDRLVLYGDTYSRKNQVTIASAPKITGFACYRNIPCHQSCFYSAALCREKPFDLQYRIRADYDHFLWCFYRAKAKMRHMDFPVACYEGGGFSENPENRRRDKQEHRRITSSYMGGARLLGYRAAMCVTLAPLRSRMAESRIFSGAYHWLKDRVYHRKPWIVAAALLFLVEMALLVWPVGWLGEPAERLSAEGVLVSVNTVSAGKVIRAVLLCALTAAGIAVGLPKNRRLRRAVGAMLLVFGPYILGRRLELLTINTEYLLPFTLIGNVCLMYLLELIVLLAARSIRFSVCFCTVFLTLLYSANYYVYSFRGTPLRMNDLSAIGTAAQVVGEYSLRPNSHLAFAWCMAVLVLAYGMQTGIRGKAEGMRRKAALGLASFCAALLLALGSGYILLYTDALVGMGFVDNHGVDQLRNYHHDGYLVASLIDIRNSRVEKPEGYSVEKVEELLEAAAAGRGQALGDGASEREMPHIIMVMNESFADLRVLGNLQISQENMPFFNSLKENTVRGCLNASVLGGGTANSEFEVFTGCSMGLLPAAYYPYEQCMVSPVSSMVSNMKAAGYTTYSMHPALSQNWNRNNVYRYLGFDQSLWWEDFEGYPYIHIGVSDLGTYEKVEELYENRGEGEKMFIFDLTIQNHGGYWISDVEKTVESVNVSSQEADNYLSLVRESDKAFEQLVAYFEKEEEPVIICMFGDHQPKIIDEAFYEGIYGQTQGLEERDKRLNLYKTPFVIWANYDIPEQEGLDIGMSYLGALLMEVAEIPCSPFFSFLQQYMEEYPMVTINGYRDREGNYHDWSGDNTELVEYRMLQYNYLFDSQTVEWGF